MENKKKIESEVDFKAFIKNPSRLFGLVFIYFFVIALVIGLYYLDVMNTASFNTVPGTSLDTLNIEREISQKVGGVKPAMDLDLISNPTNDFIAIGKTQYETTCASCHGIDGKGEGVAAAALNPKPRNFHELEGWTNGTTFYDIYKTLHEGIAGTGMIAYEYLPSKDRVAIIQYIRTFADYPEVTKAEINDKIDAKYNLSAGVVVPNNIPIKKSVSLLVDENKKENELTATIIEKITKDNGTEAVLFKDNVQNLDRVVYSYVTTFNKSNFSGFIKFVNSDPVSLGYKASVINLNDKDLQIIYSYLKYSVNQEKS
jgi:hypothetical protein